MATKLTCFIKEICQPRFYDSSYRPTSELTFNVESSYLCDFKVFFYYIKYEIICLFDFFLKF